MTFEENLKWQLTKHEGERLQMYADSKGILTIGIGHNLEERGISPAVCALMFQEDIAESIEDAETAFPWYRDLNEPRQAVIVDLIFNMGLPRFLGFKKTIRFIENELYHSASEELKDSKWCREDVHHSRSDRLSKQLMTGEWQT